MRLFGRIGACNDLIIILRTMHAACFSRHPSQGKSAGSSTQNFCFNFTQNLLHQRCASEQPSMTRKVCHKFHTQLLFLISRRIFCISVALPNDDVVIVRKYHNYKNLLPWGAMGHVQWSARRHQRHTVEEEDEEDLFFLLGNPKEP